jgi:hypothetical protein
MHKKYHILIWFRFTLERCKGAKTCAELGRRGSNLQLCLPRTHRARPRLDTICRLVSNSQWVSALGDINLGLEFGVGDGSSQLVRTEAGVSPKTRRIALGKP